MIPVINKVSTAEGPPLISVIIPAYNVAKYINRALKSVLNQTYSWFEVIIIDDGSTDQLTDLLDEFDYDSRILYVHQENAGPASARNHGLRKAKGELITFLDADDEYPNDKLLIQQQYLNEYPKVDFVSGNIQYAGVETNTLFDTSENRSMLNVHLGALLCRKEVFDTVGAFDESLRQSEDVDWWMRCLEKGVKYTFLPQIFLVYHRHQSNMTLDQQENSQYFFKALHQSIERRRTNSTVQLPNLIHKSSHKDFSRQPEVSVLVWWPDCGKEDFFERIQQQFTAVEVLLLYPEEQKPTINQKNLSEWLFLASANDFDAALTSGFELASSGFLTLYSPYSQWVSRKLTMQLDFLKKHQSFSSCSCLIRQHSSKEELASICSPQDNFPRLYRKSAFGSGDQFAAAFNEGDSSKHILPRVLEYHIL